MKTHLDAVSRATRTIVQNLLIDVLTALVALLTTALPGVEWTERWWTMLGLMLCKTALATIASYLHRILAAPSP